MNIQQIRQKYPQYDKLSDAQLAEALRKKFYPQLDKEDFERRVGLRAAPVETTTLGQVKEFGKGLVPGAVGLVESAAIGASALLPEDMEASARESIESVATAAKSPFAAAEGYEDSVGRKLGEAVGSTVPFLAAGPIGIAGRVAAVGLGVGAGAGEARTRAEESGATADQRGTATALGIIPGAAEVFAPFRILGRLPDAVTAEGTALVKRALIAGGEEAAQEAASGFAQNLIARGVYKPEQELIEGLGEQAAYGGATGAIVQGLLDLAIGRRARGTAQDDTERTALEEQVLAARAARETDAVARELQGAVPTVPETDLFGNPVSREEPPAEKEMTRKQAIAARVPTMQMPLMFEREAETAVEEETVPGAITMEELQGIGKPMRTSKSWFEDNVVGKTPEQVQAMVDADPKLIEGKTARAQVLREILAPKPAEFVEASSETAAPTPDVRPKRTRKRSTTEPSVGTPVEPIQQPDAAGTQTPDATGVVPADGPVGAAPSVEGTGAPALTPEDQAFDQLARAVQDESSPEYAEAGQILEANRNNPAFLTKYDAAVRRVNNYGPRVEPATQTDAEPTVEEDVGPTESELPPQRSLFAMSPEEEVQLAASQEAAARQRERDELEGKRAEAWAGVPDVKRTKAAQGKLPLEDKGPKVEVEGPGRGVATESLTTAVAAQDTRGALQEIASGEGFSPIDRLVANRLLRSKSLPKIAKSDGLDAPGQYFPKIDTAVLREVDSHTVLHETVHGFVHRLIAAENAGSVQSAGVRKLRAVMQYVAKANPALRNTYGYKNLSEFASEAMSNPEFQAELRKIPYQRTNAFTAFARAVLDMLGIKGTTENNALAESLISVESILDTGRAMEVAEAGTDADRMADAPAAPEMRRESKQAVQPAPSNMDEIVRTSELAKGEPNVIVEAMKDLVNAFTKAEGVTFGDRFRTTIVDTGATVETKINKLFDGAVRSAKGMLNPMGLYRQAQDTSKLLLTWFEDGALVKNPTTGTYETATKDGVPAMKDVLDGVKAWGESKGYSFDESLIRVSKMLEARRLDALRKSNAAGTTDFSINKLSLKDPRSADAQIDAALADYAANPEIAAIKQQMDTMRFELIDQMVATGRLSAEEGTSWKEATDYVPFDRIEDFATQFRSAKRTGGGIAQLGKLPELVTTKEREVGNVLDNFTKTSGWMLNQIVKQDATKTTLRMLEDMGYATFKGRNGKSIPPERRVSSYVKGEQVFYELPSRWDALAFRDMAEPKGAFVRFFSGFSDLLRKTITSMPPFAVRQVVNDIQRAFATSGVQNPYAIILPSLRNFATISVAEVMGKRHPSVRQFGKLGITGDYDFNTRNPMDSIMYDLGFKARGPVRGLLHRLDGITRASDLAVRKAIYDQTMKESQDALLAQTRAREFINFRRRGAGAAMPALTATIPFFNAYLQGMDVLYRAATGKGASGSVAKAEARRMFASRMATMASFAAIYAIMMSGDDEYEEADLRTRNNNWILPGGFKLPVPEELSAIYKVPVEMALEYFRRNGTPEEMEAAEASITAMKYAFEQYLGRTVPIPAAIKPVAEAITNHSFFTGQQLEGTFQQELLPSQRVRASTSELAKAIANFTSETFGEKATISPIKIDNFLQGYFGSVAGMLTMATDQLINPDRLDRPLNKYWMLSNFLHDPVGTRRINEFYELREKVVPKLNTLNELAKTDIDKAEKFMQENEQDLILAQAINGALGQLSDTRAYKNFLNSKASAESMSMEERKTALEEVRRMETELVGWLREARASVRDQ
jgi:hypothetical protein